MTPLESMTTTVLETAPELEMEDHLGYPKHAPAGTGQGQLA